jgi:hypothetical protein
MYGAVFKGPVARFQLWFLDLLFTGRNDLAARALKRGLIMFTVRIPWHLVGVAVTDLAQRFSLPKSF